MARLVVASDSRAGRRPENEDVARSGTRRGAAWALVADGMGGHAAGEVASALAAESAARALESVEKGEEAQAQLERAFWDAANEVGKRAKLPDHDGMGTTLVLSLFSQGELWVGHAGDSLAFLIEEDGARQLTRPHTLVETEIAAGRLTPEEAANHPYRHAVGQALGSEPLEPEFQRVTLGAVGRQGAVLLVASDGVTNHVTPEEMTTVVRSTENLDAAVRSLIDLALAKGSDDNVAAAAIEVGVFPRVLPQSVRKRRRAIAVLASAALVTGAALAWLLTSQVANAPSRDSSVAGSLASSSVGAQSTADPASAELGASSKLQSARAEKPEGANPLADKQARLEAEKARALTAQKETEKARERAAQQEAAKTRARVVQQGAENAKAHTAQEEPPKATQQSAPASPSPDPPAAEGLPRVSLSQEPQWRGEPSYSEPTGLPIHELIPAGGGSPLGASRTCLEGEKLGLADTRLISLPRPRHPPDLKPIPVQPRDQQNCPPGRSEVRFRVFVDAQGRVQLDDDGGFEKKNIQFLSETCWRTRLESKRVATQLSWEPGTCEGGVPVKTWSDVITVSFSNPRKE